MPLMSISGVLQRLVEAVRSDEIAQPELRHGRRRHQIRHTVADVGRVIVIRAVGELKPNGLPVATVWIQDSS